MANDQPLKLYLQWMNDAYSQELALTPVLENHAKDLESHGLDNSRIHQHVTDTKRHAESLKECITRNGGDVSSLKTALGKTVGAVQSVASGMFSDELIKNYLSDFAAENMEIASYTSLIAAAEQIGDTQTATACKAILADEVAMAEWLKEQIPLITRHMMQDATKKEHA